VTRYEIEALGRGRLPLGADGVTGDAERRAMRTIIDQAGGESPDTRTLTYLVAHNDLQGSLSGGSGRQFFRRR
jgi:hypothetical protein